jgi:hypothetical protein
VRSLIISIQFNVHNPYMCAAAQQQPFNRCGIDLDGQMDNRIIDNPLDLIVLHYAFLLLYLLSSRKYTPPL